MECNEGFGAGDSRLAFRDLNPSQPTKLDAILPARDRVRVGVGASEMATSAAARANQTALTHCLYDGARL